MIQSELSENKRAIEILEEQFSLYAGETTEETDPLIILAANFVITHYGRPGALLADSDELDAGVYKKIVASRDNHMRLKDIIIGLLNSHDFSFLTVERLILLISDLDLALDGEFSPYSGEYQGIRKFLHSDFEDFRKLLFPILENFLEDSLFSSLSREEQGAVRSINRRIFELAEF